MGRWQMVMKTVVCVTMRGRQSLVPNKASVVFQLASNSILSIGCCTAQYVFNVHLSPFI